MAGLLATLGSAALAQVPAGAGTPAPAAAAPQNSRAAPVSSSPDRTTASFGDWTLRCERPSVPAGSARICEIAQSIQIQGQQAPIAQIAIGRVNKSDPLTVTIVLPHNVTLSAQPGLLAEEKDAKPFGATWQRCLPIGCMAELVLRDDLVKRFRSLNEAGAILFKDGASRDIKLPFSMRGLSSPGNHRCENPARDRAAPSRPPRRSHRVSGETPPLVPGSASPNHNLR